MATSVTIVAAPILIGRHRHSVFEDRAAARDEKVVFARQTFVS